MKQQAYRDNISDISGEVITTEFALEANESMIQMLTQSVYKDPILAVIREWSTNACDACLMGNKPVKFDVHLPTTEDTTFFVRDYGIGLSKQDVVTIFSTLGASTKRDSNLVNGTLGIGRMAGLAVADAFTVESFLEGIHSTYVISMQKGKPVTIDMGSVPTAEENGIKISLDVPYSDISVFKEKASLLYIHFDYKPNLNLKDIVIELDTTGHISEDWYIAKNDRTYSISNYVVMCQVCYEIPNDYVVKNKGFKNLVLKAPAGSVTFNPGRESLSLDKKTVEFINNAFIEIEKEYVEAAVASMALANNDKELMARYTAVTKAVPSNIIDLIDPTPFASDEFKTLFTVGGYARSTNSNISFRALTITDAFIQKTNKLVDASYKNSYYKTSRKMSLDTYQSVLSFSEFFNAHHVIIDLKSKYRKALNDNFDGKPLITWLKTDKDTDIDLAVAEIKGFLDVLGVSYQLASDIVALVDVTTSEVVPREGLYVRPIERDGTVQRAQVMKEDNALSNDYLYVRLNNTTPVQTDPSFSMSNYFDMCALMRNTGYSLPPIIGVPKKYQEYVDDLDNWMDFETYVKDKSQEVTFKALKKEQKYASNSFATLAELVNEDSPEDMQKFMKEYREYQNFRKSTEYISSSHSMFLANLFNANIEYFSLEDPEDITVLVEKYPLTFALATSAYTQRVLLNTEQRRKLMEMEKLYAVHNH